MTHLCWCKIKNKHSLGHKHCSAVISIVQNGAKLFMPNLNIVHPGESLMSRTHEYFSSFAVDSFVIFMAEWNTLQNVHKFSWWCLSKGQRPPLMPTWVFDVWNLVGCFGSDEVPWCNLPKVFSSHFTTMGLLGERNVFPCAVRDLYLSRDELWSSSRWSLVCHATANRSHIWPSILSYTRCLIACPSVHLGTFVCPVWCTTFTNKTRKWLGGNACFLASQHVIQQERNVLPFGVTALLGAGQKKLWRGEVKLWWSILSLLQIPFVWHL